MIVLILLNMLLILYMFLTYKIIQNTFKQDKIFNIILIFFLSLGVNLFLIMIFSLLTINFTILYDLYIIILFILSIFCNIIISIFNNKQTFINVIIFYILSNFYIYIKYLTI